MPTPGASKRDGQGVAASVDLGSPRPGDRKKAAKKLLQENICIISEVKQAGCSLCALAGV